MAQSIGERIDAEIANNKVMVFSKSYCPFANATKQLLQSKNIEFGVIELDQDASGTDIQNALKTKTGQSTVPNVFINGQHIGGNSDVQALNNSGELMNKVNA